MTAEDDFQRALDADPGAHHTRLVFADWLQERGDPRAEGYRALGAGQRAPRRSGATLVIWVWTSLPGHPETLPEDWMDGYALLPDRVHSASRRQAEDYAALAFAALPAARRAELLAGGVGGG